MLYTITPLERVFTDRTNSLLKNTNLEVSNENDSLLETYRNITIKHGNVYTRKEGEQYIVEGIQSTNMGDYLDSRYTPGKQMDI